MKKGLWKAEVFRVVYQDADEVKPDRQIGTIRVSDGVNDHYVYNVNKSDRRKPTIRYLDDVVLTGPQIASISAENSFAIDVNLFNGAYKDFFRIEDCPTDDLLKICSPLQRKITSKDGSGEIAILFAIFKNATEAHVGVKLLADDDFTTGVYGAVTACTDKMKSHQHSSILFLKKPNDKIIIGHTKLFPLSRSIVAVPLESEFILDMHLLTGDNDCLFKGSVKFKAERNITRKKLVDGKNCKIQVKVTWKSA